MAIGNPFMLPAVFLFFSTCPCYSLRIFFLEEQNFLDSFCLGVLLWPWISHFPLKVLVPSPGEWDLEVSIWELECLLLLLGCHCTQPQSVGRHIHVLTHTYIYICIYFSIYQSIDRSIIYLSSICWKVIPIIYVCVYINIHIYTRCYMLPCTKTIFYLFWAPSFHISLYGHLPHLCRSLGTKLSPWTALLKQLRFCVPYGPPPLLRQFKLLFCVDFFLILLGLWHPICSVHLCGHLAHSSHHIKLPYRVPFSICMALNSQSRPPHMEKVSFYCSDILHWVTPCEDGLLNQLSFEMSCKCGHLVGLCYPRLECSHVWKAFLSHIGSSVIGQVVPRYESPPYNCLSSNPVPACSPIWMPSHAT